MSQYLEQILYEHESSQILYYLAFADIVKGKLIITRPSFSYYEQFCQSFGIAYDTWELDENFEYDLLKLSDLPDYSVVFLTTPNNPTGNILPIKKISELLEKHKNSLFIVDEAYAEFIEQPLLPLLDEYNNLLLLRTFSKAFCSAGVRCGILMGDTLLITALSRLQTPWQLSSFAIEATKVILDYAQETNWFKDQINSVISEREKLFRACSNAKNNLSYTIFPSYANFLLIRAKNKVAHETLLESCVSNGIMVSNLDKEPRLSNCIRVTIGKPEGNNLFQQAFYQAIKKLS